jgi:hypothetical protein
MKLAFINGFCITEKIISGVLKKGIKIQKKNLAGKKITLQKI